ncbi:MAG: beta-galactosidase GalA [Acidobacteriaceae bacterium]|nr:beta-galactosidase GalA [Acidobacteriaceae bacterium]
MPDLTRRQLIKSSLAVSAGSILPTMPLAAEAVASIASEKNAVAPAKATSRERLLMDFNWKFSLGNSCDPAKDASYGELAHMNTFAKADSIVQAKTKFDDSSWHTVDLPHDWAVDLPFISIASNIAHGARPIGREYPETSVGWYRKTFNLSSADKGKRIQIQFDGIFRNAIVFLNGHYIATNFSGYAPLLLDITDWVELDQPNILAVRVDATLGEGWFYEGAGVYRHVWLIKSDPVYLIEWGTWIRSDVTDAIAQIKLGSEVKNSSDSAKNIYVTWELLDPTGNRVATARSEDFNLLPGCTYAFEGHTLLHNPVLWSLANPTLYKAVATVQWGSTNLDSDHTSFGIRTIRFDSDKGFFLNGNPVKIKGTCCHQDHAGIGVALPDRVQYFRMERLKSMGSNALRTSHNPPTPELMDAADTLGMLVMCETRMMDASPEGLSQLERMIRRFRNHPSIFIWSLGNEEPEQGTDIGARIVTTMKHLAHELDPTRPCTVAMNGGYGTGASRVVDVQGFNYHEHSIEKFHHDFPHQRLIGTETASTVSTRGIYENDKAAGYVSAYDTNTPPWASTAESWWKFYDEHEFLAGGFAWTGFDYRGEPTPYGWPCVSSHFGIMDTCGFPKDAYFYYQSWWGSEPVLHLFPHWNWPVSKQGQEIDVWCYTNLTSVELFVNGTSQGVQKVLRNTHVEWKVKYQPGVIEVRGSKDGETVMTAKRETTGEPAKIVLRPDRSQINADGNDVTIIAVEVQDAQGRLMPIASNDIAFQVEGLGKLLGVGNGDPSSHESDKANHRKVFNGLAQVIIQSFRQLGSITIQATSPGLESSTVVIATHENTLALPLI